MPARFDLVTIDVEHPDVAASFWTQALGLVEAEREDGDRWIALSTPDGNRRIGLQKGAHRPGGTHLDLVCDLDEFDDEHRRLVTLGAVTLCPPRHEHYGAIVNLADPEGNVFDLCAYTR
jgi:predicted enzyme related to lactoylglutathione lyase